MCSLDWSEQIQGWPTPCQPLYRRQNLIVIRSHGRFTSRFLVLWVTHSMPDLAPGIDQGFPMFSLFISELWERFRKVTAFPHWQEPAEIWAPRNNECTSIQGCTRHSYVGRDPQSWHMDYISWPALEQLGIPQDELGSCAATTNLMDETIWKVCWIICLLWVHNLLQMSQSPLVFKYWLSSLKCPSFPSCPAPSCSQRLSFAVKINHWDLRNKIK